MSKVKLPMHGAATHGKHGPDPVGTQLAVTNGSTVIDPADELDIGSGLSLTDLGDGVAQIANAGLRFEVDNEGLWLKIGTTGALAGNGILLLAAGTGHSIKLDAAFNLILNAVNSMVVTAGSVNMTATDQLFTSDNATLALQDALQPVKFILRNACPAFAVYNDVDVAPILEARADGTVHIRTGATIIADL